MPKMHDAPAPTPARTGQPPRPEDGIGTSHRTSSGKEDPSETPPAAPPPPKELNPNTGVTNLPNPALPPDAYVGTLEQPVNTGSGDTPAPAIEGNGSMPGPVDKDGKPIETVATIGTGPYPKDTPLPTQEELPETPSEAT